MLDGIEEAGGTTLRFADGSAIAIGKQLVSGEAVAELRPEAIHLTRKAAPSGNSFKGAVTHHILLRTAAESAVSVQRLGDFLITADRRSRRESDLDINSNDR